MTISNAEQFGLLLWKNWLLQKRRIVVTVFQILTPALFAFILLLIRIKVDSVSYSFPFIYYGFYVTTTLPPNLTLPDTAHGSGGSDNQRWTLVYSPDTLPAATRMARSVAQMLNITPTPIGIVIMAAHAYACKAIIFYRGSFFFERCPRWSLHGNQPHFATCSDSEVSRI